VSRVGKRLVSIAAFTGAIRKEHAGNQAVLKTVCMSGLHRVFIGFMGFFVWVGFFRGESVLIRRQNRDSDDHRHFNEREGPFEFVFHTQFAARFWHKIHMAMHGGRRLRQHKNQGLR